MEVDPIIYKIGGISSMWLDALSFSGYKHWNCSISVIWSNGAVIYQENNSISPIALMCLAT
jgi:hypothetical protein